ALNGVDVWEYRAVHTDEGAVFDAAMTGLSRRVNDAVAAAHDFGRYGVLVDIGGGHGALLLGILARHPGVLGVLFDQPGVVAGAQRADHVIDLIVGDLDEREAVGDLDPADLARGDAGLVDDRADEVLRPDPPDAAGAHEHAGHRAARTGAFLARGGRGRRDVR